MIDADAYRLESLNKAIIRAEEEGRAIQNAFESHPIVPLVKNLPVESAVYPANRYFMKSLDGNGQETITFIDASQTRYIPKQGTPFGDLITWSMPARDRNRSREKGCGVIRSSDGTAVYTACEHDHEHHLKAKQKHCWSRHCPRCMNDTCLRDGIAVEKRFLAYKTLCAKEGINVGDPAHVVVSPPQEMIKHAMQTYEDYKDIVRYIDSQLQKYGSSAGYTVFHPWRQKGRKWVVSPHFHILLFGFIDTKGFIRENPGWIIKKLHAHEKIRSIHQTVAYILTHAGLPIVEVDPSEVSWGRNIMEMFDPSLTRKDCQYNEEDYFQLGNGRGRIIGDTSMIDWVEWTKRKLMKVPRTVYWGGMAKSKIRIVDNIREYKIRVCRSCSSFIRVYQGFTDTVGDYSRYIKDNPIMCFARNVSAVKAFILNYKSRLRNDPENSLIDLVKLMPNATCTLEFMPQNNDLTMPGPFSEPDSFFLERQAKALGLGSAQYSA